MDYYNKSDRNLKELSIDTLALTRGHGLIWDLAGPARKHVRQSLMERLTGRKLPIAKCGINALNTEYLKAYLIPRGCIREEEDRLSAELKYLSVQ